jgi:hypothetical protein
MVDKELHPVVQLLLERMKSHPEEFKDEYLTSGISPVDGSGRWNAALTAIYANGSEHDREAINGALRGIRMEQVHEWVLDELLNGEDRRKEYEEATRQYTSGLAGAVVPVSGREALRITSNGALGIGTASPSQAQNALNARISEGKLDVGLVKRLKGALGI